MVEAAKQYDQNAIREIYFLCYDDLYVIAKQAYSDEKEVLLVIEEIFAAAVLHLELLPDPTVFFVWISALMRERVGVKDGTIKSYMESVGPLVIPNADVLRRIIATVDPEGTDARVLRHHHTEEEIREQDEQSLEQDLKETIHNQNRAEEEARKANTRAQERLAGDRKAAWDEDYARVRTHTGSSNHPTASKNTGKNQKKKKSGLDRKKILLIVLILLLIIVIIIIFTIGRNLFGA